MVYYFMCMPFFKEIINVSKDEEVIGVFRSHVATAILSLIPFVCVLIVICLFLFPFLSLGLKGVVIFSLLILLDAIFISTILSQWIGTILILTSRRLISVNRRSMFKKRVNEYQLETITEISYDCKGLLQTFFSLGDINITALYTGTRHTVIRCVAGPQRVLDSISHAIAKLQKNTNASGQRKDDLRQVLVDGDEKQED